MFLMEWYRVLYGVWGTAVVETYMMVGLPSSSSSLMHVARRISAHVFKLGCVQLLDSTHDPRHRSVPVLTLFGTKLPYQQPKEAVAGNKAQPEVTNNQVEFTNYTDESIIH